MSKYPQFADVVRCGASFQEACMLMEAMYSCAIEGVALPKNDAELKGLIKMCKEDAK